MDYNHPPKDFAVRPAISAGVHSWIAPTTPGTIGCSACHFGRSSQLVPSQEYEDWMLFGLPFRQEFTASPRSCAIRFSLFGLPFRQEFTASSASTSNHTRLFGLPFRQEFTAAKKLDELWTGKLFGLPFRQEFTAGRAGPAA